MRQSTGSWPRDALPLGTSLHGYRIEALLGRGGFGITYRAVDAIDQHFAIKECFPKQFAVRQGLDMFPTDEEEAEPLNDCLSRFMKEARALKRLSTIGAAGDGVVKVATFFQTNGTAYLVMEYLSGQSLEALIKANPKGIDPAQLDDILPRLLHAVGCVHDAGLLHRDIKPGNIMLREDGRPVLIDFGAVRGTTLGRNDNFTQIYAEGYAPIEQVSGTAQGPFSDIYALGATCYRAIGGITVDSFTRHQAVLRGKRDPQSPAVEIGAGRYPLRLLKSIDAAMIVTAKERPQSVGELISMIRGAIDEAPTVRVVPKLRLEEESRSTARDDENNAAPAPSLPALEKPRPPGRRRRLGNWAALVGLPVLVLGGGIVYWIAAYTAAPNDAPAMDAAADRAASLAAARTASAARSAATDLEHRAKAEVFTLGLESKEFLQAADAIMTRAENEWVKGTNALAAADFTTAAGQIRSETRNFLEQHSAAYARQSQSRLTAGDVEGAEKALEMAKKIKQAEAGFP